MKRIELVLEDNLAAVIAEEAKAVGLRSGPFLRMRLIDIYKDRTNPPPPPALEAPAKQKEDFEDDPKLLRKAKLLWRDKYKMPFPPLKSQQGADVKNLLQILESGVDPWWEKQGDERVAGFACYVLGSNQIFPEGWLVFPARLIDGIHSVQGDKQHVYGYWPKSWWAEQVRDQRTRYDVADEIWRAIEGEN